MPIVVSKIIWSSYIMKPTSDMCKRILKKYSSVCGIYKITNIITNEKYIGQSRNISDRWKEHIKCGLGIDAPATNKLYNNMQKYGVWNFTFDLLEECPSSQLNEKERSWIEMYKSNIIGLNTQKGNK
jgi:group I intron endonuclease